MKIGAIGFELWLFINFEKKRVQGRGGGVDLVILMIYTELFKQRESFCYGSQEKLLRF